MEKINNFISTLYKATFCEYPSKKMDNGQTMRYHICPVMRIHQDENIP